MVLLSMTAMGKFGRIRSCWQFLLSGEPLVQDVGNSFATTGPLRPAEAHGCEQLARVSNSRLSSR